ncbi:unnamed protein product [Victoria cruziana]
MLDLPVGQQRIDIA